MYIYIYIERERYVYHYVYSEGCRAHWNTNLPRLCRIMLMRVRDFIAADCHGVAARQTSMTTRPQRSK